MSVNSASASASASVFPLSNSIVKRDGFEVWLNIGRTPDKATSKNGAKTLAKVFNGAINYDSHQTIFGVFSPYTQKYGDVTMYYYDEQGVKHHQSADTFIRELYQQVIDSNPGDADYEEKRNEAMANMRTVKFIGDLYNFEGRQVDFDQFEILRAGISTFRSIRLFFYASEISTPVQKDCYSLGKGNLDEFRVVRFFTELETTIVPRQMMDANYIRECAKNSIYTPVKAGAEFMAVRRLVSGKVGSNKTTVTKAEATRAKRQAAARAFMKQKAQKAQEANISSASKTVTPSVVKTVEQKTVAEKEVIVEQAPASSTPAPAPAAAAAPASSPTVVEVEETTAVVVEETAAVEVDEPVTVEVEETAALEVEECDNDYFYPEEVVDCSEDDDEAAFFELLQESAADEPVEEATEVVEETTEVVEETTEVVEETAEVVEDSKGSATFSIPPDVEFINDSNHTVGDFSPLQLACVVNTFLDGAPTACNMLRPPTPTELNLISDLSEKEREEAKHYHRFWLDHLDEGYQDDDDDLAAEIIDVLKENFRNLFNEVELTKAQYVEVIRDFDYRE